MTDTNEYTLSTGDAAKVLGCHQDTVARWADAGQIAFWRTPGGYRRFRQADLDAFAASRLTPEAS